MGNATGKSTNPEVTARVEELEAMLMSGKTSGEVRQYATSTWGVSVATANIYMGRARAATAARLRDSGKLNELLGWCLHSYRCIYQKCMEHEHYAVAKSTLDSLVDVLGLKRPVKIDVQHRMNGAFKPLEQMTDAELAEWAMRGGVVDGTTPGEHEERGDPPSAH
jgi:hypothetical protein